MIYSPPDQQPPVKKFVHDHIVLVSALLSIVSLSLVFGAAGGYIPAEYLPRSDPVLKVIPHFNAFLSILAIITILKGVSHIRNKDIERHNKTMLLAFTIFATFLILYLYRVAIVGPAEFGGPENINLFIYLPFLAIHILLAVICVPLLFYVLTIGLTYAPGEIPGTSHRRVGKVAYKLWLIAFIMGSMVYLMAYHIYPP